MRRMLTIIASVAVALAATTASADTHLWLTTDGAGVDISSRDGHHAPPPPHYRPHHEHHGHGYCKICKKHYKEARKAAKKHQKWVKKHQEKHHDRHHHR